MNEQHPKVSMLKSVGQRVLHNQYPMALLVILITAFVLRVPVTKSGFPYIHYWDEPFVMNSAINIAKTGDFDPHYQHYPGGYINAQAILATIGMVKMAKAGDLKYTSDIKTGFETKYLWTATHPDLYRNGRMLTVYISLLLILLTYYLGRVAFNRPAGLLAALFMTISPGVAVCSVTISTDIPSAACTTACLYIAVLLAKAKITPWKAAIYGGALTGVAFGVKYNAAIIGSAFVVAYIIRMGLKFKALHILLYFISLAVAFLTVSPGAILNYGEFVQSLMRQVTAYSNWGGFNESSSSLQNFFKYLKEIATHGFSYLIPVFALFGIVLSAIRNKRTTAVLMVFTVIYLFIFARMKIHFFRNMMPLMPVVALFAAAGFVYGWQWLVGRQMKYRRFIALSVLLLSCALPLFIQLQRFHTFTTGPDDTRTQAYEEIKELLKPGEIAIWDENLHPYFPKRKQGKPKIMSTAKIYAASPDQLKMANARYLVVPVKYDAFDTYRTVSSSFQTVSAQLGKRFSELPVVKKYDGNSLVFGRLPESPGLIVYDLENAQNFTDWEGLIPGQAFAAEGQAVANYENASLELYSAGKLSHQFENQTTVSQASFWMNGYHKHPSHPRVNVTFENLDDPSRSVTVMDDHPVPGDVFVVEHKREVDIAPGRWNIVITHLNPSEPELLTAGSKIRGFGLHLVELR